MKKIIFLFFLFITFNTCAETQMGSPIGYGYRGDVKYVADSEEDFDYEEILRDPDAYKWVDTGMNNVNKYNLDDNQIWAVEFEYGVIRGEASCSQLPNNLKPSKEYWASLNKDTIPVLPYNSLNKGTTSGAHCWCRITESNKQKLIHSQWVFSDWYYDNEKTLSEDNVYDCAVNCSYQCAKTIYEENYDGLVRTKLLEGIANTTISSKTSSTNVQQVKDIEKVNNSVLSHSQTDLSVTTDILPPNPFRELYNRAVELEQKYLAAKEREQSLANRMLGGATMALTGIGGMELAQGLAEQKADKDAELDMDAYLATFKCEYGNNRAQGSETGIELPGANNLFDLYQEYMTLAADLKERKEALGLKPGIESEVVLDKANTGLYDDTSTGITNGTYASLYRAKMGSDVDRAKLQEISDTSKKRVTGGAVTAGAGATFGIGGNILLNKIDWDKTSQETEEE
ncbi:MAG: hypothetical protein ACLRFJ_03805 [Alphaproteobacteria bacterium]